MNIVSSSFDVFRRYPVFLVPLLTVWIIYAPTVLYLRYGVNWDVLATSEAVLINLGAIFLFAFLLTMSCSVLLELIEIVESDQKPGLGRAIRATMGSNLVHMLPIVVVWTVIWFVLAVIQALLSRKKNRGDRPKFSAEDAARTLMGGGRFSLSAAFFRALQKAVRMVVFLILPAIAWERMGFIRGTKRGLAVFRSQLGRFAEGFAITELATIVLFLPPALLAMLTRSFDVTLPTGVWVAVIIYTGCAWSYSIYLEQMYMAELYLWNLKWERTSKARELRGEEPLAFDKVPRPHLLDNVHDLLEPAARNRPASSLASAS
ncbi:MAG TPA: hypothetical protein VMS98_20300 [Thermoanaerobaculia bacterium]|nr:hypothetical protein [Thermoanaerobaculia bacterium]